MSRPPFKVVPGGRDSGDAQRPRDRRDAAGKLLRGDRGLPRVCRGIDVHRVLDDLDEALADPRTGDPRYYQREGELVVARGITSAKREPAAPEVRRHVFQLRLQPGDAKRLDRLARAAKLTRSELLRELLKRADEEGQP